MNGRKAEAAMERTQSVTIKLTARQREQLGRLVGAEHSAITFETVSPGRRAVRPLAGKSAPKASIFQHKTPPASQGLVFRVKVPPTTGITTRYKVPTLPGM
ncbi:MAG TPA: hypothetical protein VJS92_13590 [Candidatus Polarisedimenticolaceae bacterium]|nr:hypothetical protein [Candidatus Polarisedimenticolaceae bacterium]